MSHVTLLPEPCNIVIWALQQKLNERVPNFFPDYQEHLSEDEDLRWTYRLCADGTWEANLFNFYQRVLPRLQSVLPKPFKLESNIRKEETPAHIAVREALINLCVHADYSVNASLVVRHELHRFVFSNPGTMLISREQYYTGGESVCRNKSLQKMFSMLGVAEKAGGGADKIMKGWREANWRSPKIEETQKPDKVVLTMPMESFLSEDAKDELTQKFGIVANSFDHNVLSTLALASDEGYVTNMRLRFLLNLHKSEISEMLKSMTQNGLLITKGYGRGMRYYLPRERCNVFGVLDSKVATSGNKGRNLNGSKVATFPKKRMSYNDLKAKICEVAVDWIELIVIAASTGKDYSYLRNRIIPRLINENVIEMLYPDTPNHPKQKYKVKN